MNMNVATQRKPKRTDVAKVNFVWRDHIIVSTRVWVTAIFDALFLFKYRPFIMYVRYIIEANSVDYFVDTDF